LDLPIEFQKQLYTGGLQPVTIFTDANSVMQVAIGKQYPKTIVRHCIFHIQQNLVKKIKKKLNNKWDNFIGDFYNLHNSLVISDFENR
jgi:transposase-like protein